MDSKHVRSEGDQCEYYLDCRFVWCEWMFVPNCDKFTRVSFVLSFLFELNLRL